MQALFYNFDKRANSTKQPTGGTAIDCVLKWTGGDLFRDETYKVNNSILAPTLVLNYTGIFGYTYASLFGNYYYVIDVSYGINNMVEVTCTIDLLATYKANILATTAKVLYSASEYNLNIDDTRNSCTEVPDAVWTTESFLDELRSNVVEERGTFIANIIGEPPEEQGDYLAQGFATTYYFNRTQMELFAASLLDPTVLEALSNTFLQPTDAVVSFAYTAFSFGDVAIGGAKAVTGVGMGPIALTTPASAQSANEYFTSVSIITIPRRYNDYREGNRLSRFVLYIPYSGEIEIDPDLIYGVESLRLNTYVDAATTNFAGYVDTYASGQQGRGKIVANYSGCMATPMPIGQTMPFVGELLTGMATAGAVSGGIGALGTAGAIASAGGELAAAAAMATTASAVPALIGVGASIATIGAVGLGAASKAINAAESGASIIRAGTKKSGTMGGSLGFVSSGFFYEVPSHESVRPFVTLVHYYQTTCDDPLAIKDVAGLPLNKTRLLSGLTGFVQTRGASVSGDMLQPIRLKLNELLDGGIYIE